MISNRRVMKINAWVQNNYLTSVIILVAINLVESCPSIWIYLIFGEVNIPDYYVLSYQTAGGFVSRGLVGTILDIFVNTVTLKFLWSILLYFIVYSFIILLLLEAKKSTEPHLLSALILMLMFSPAITNYACDISARPDIFLVMITLLCMHLIAKNQFLFFIPILCVMGICIHEGFVLYANYRNNLFNQSYSKEIIKQIQPPVL